LKLLTENESTYIPIGKKHRLANRGKIPAFLIEVQSGAYLGEDDIIRYDDVYRRGVELLNAVVSSVVALLRKPMTVGDGVGVSTRTRTSITVGDHLTAALLFLSLFALYSLTRSRWLDDWDSVQFALALDSFDLRQHQPHPPGYPLYVAAGKLLRSLISDHAACLTLLSSMAGAANAAMFYIVTRRYVSQAIGLCATLVMALSPLFWLQAGLAFTDMFGLLFVLLFLLAEGATPNSGRLEFFRRASLGFIAGLSLGARPHFTILILAFWYLRQRAYAISPAPSHPLFITCFVAGLASWLVPTCWVAGGLGSYLSSCLSQFEWRFDRPSVSPLGSPLSATYLLGRVSSFVVWLGTTFGPADISHDFLVGVVLGLAFTVPYVVLAWRGAAKAIARPYMAASAVYLFMLFVLLPAENQRYFLPFSLIVGWSVTGLFTLPHRPLIRAASLALIASTLVSSLMLIPKLSNEPPPIAALKWISSNRPDAILYTSGLQRHAKFYWPEGKVRSVPTRLDQCAALHHAPRPILSTSKRVCGISGRRIRVFERDERVNSKHHKVTLFELP
jgi:hypothetical protein